MPVRTGAPRFYGWIAGAGITDSATGLSAMSTITWPSSVVSIVTGDRVTKSLACWAIIPGGSRTVTGTGSGDGRASQLPESGYERCQAT